MINKGWIKGMDFSVIGKTVFKFGEIDADFTNISSQTLLKLCIYRCLVQNDAISRQKCEGNNAEGEKPPGQNASQGFPCAFQFSSFKVMMTRIYPALITRGCRSFLISEKPF